MEVPARKSYPRALPHRAPEHQGVPSDAVRRSVEKLTAQNARLRRQSVCLVVALIVLVVIVSGVVCWTRFANPSGAAEPPDPSPVAESPSSFAKPLAETKNPPAKSATPSLKEPLQASPSSKLSDPAGAKVPPAAPKPPADASATQKELYLEALGGLSAAHLYESYLIMGLLADGVESKAYPMEGAKDTLKIVTGCMNLVEGKLAKLDTTSMDQEDQESLQRLKAVTALLRLESTTLLAWWTSGDTEQADQFRQSRKSAWTGLSKVLGLEPE